MQVCGAVEMAKRMGPGHTIVTVLCDSGFRYGTKCVNPPRYPCTERVGLYMVVGGGTALSQRRPLWHQVRPRPE